MVTHMEYNLEFSNATAPTLHQLGPSGPAAGYNPVNVLSPTPHAAYPLNRS